MAEPSLGYAIGLNVKRQDIFAPAAKQLSQNLAAWKADKAQAKKEKEAKASKAMDEMMKFDPSTFNRKIRSEATAGFEKSKKELENAIEAGKSERELLDIVYQAGKNLASYKDQSNNRDLLDKYVLANPGKAPTVLTNYSANNRSRLSEDEIVLLQGFGVGYDRETNILTSFGYEPVDVRAALNQAKPTEDELLATTSQDDIQKNISIIKTKAGYDPIAFARLKPPEQRYALSLANVMYNEPGAIGSISEEVLRKDYGGNYDRYLVATRSKLDEMMKNTKEGDPLPTPFDAQRAIAIDYMVKTHAPEWIQASTKTINLTEPPKVTDPKNKGAQGNPAAATAEGHLSTAGKKLAKNLGMDEQTAINISLNRVEATPEQRKIANKITKNNILGEGPTVSFNTGGTEVVTIGSINVNPRKLWYDTKNKKFHLSYDKQVSGEGTSYNLAAEDKVLTWEELKQLDSSGNTNVKAQLEQWDLNAAANKVPTVSNYILSKGTARAAAAAPSGSGSASSYNWTGGK